MSESLECYFETDRDTPGTRKFKEIPQEEGRPPVGSLYITKDALEKLGMPGKIKITIEAE